MPDPIEPPEEPIEEPVEETVEAPTEAPSQAPTRFPTGSMFPDDIEEPVEPTERPTARAVLRAAGVVGGRVVIGAVAVAVIGAVVAAASLVSFPREIVRAPSEVVAPVPAAQQVVCPGALLRIANAQGKGASRASSLGPPAIAAGASSGGVARSALKSSDAGTAGSPSAPQILGTPPVSSGGTQTLLSGAQSQAISTNEFFGLAAAACTAAVGDAWLVGGATSTGRTTLLVLANPSEVPATVAIQIFGEKGAVTAPGMSGIVIAAGGQRILSLAGFAPGLESPVVHVHSRGGQISASLEQSTVRGVEPGGIDFVPTQAVASRTNVVPGVQLAGTERVQARRGEDGFDDLETVLRVFVPGTKSTSVRVSVLPEDHKVKGVAFETRASGGTVTDLPIDDLVDGGYTVVVTTGLPAVVGMRVSTAGSTAVAKRTDFAWLGSATLLHSESVLPVAPGVTAMAQFENPGKSTQTVTLHALDGSAADSTVKVPAGGTAAVPVASGTVYRISGFTGIYAAVSATTDGGVAGYSIHPAAPGSSPLRIYG